MKLLHQLEIPKRSTRCVRKGEPFNPGMEVFSLLQENEDQELSRSDYCAGCWREQQQTLASKPEVRGHWKSKIEFKKQVAESSRTQRALSLLKELVSNPEGHAEEIFVLSLFLAHARLIVLRQEFHQEGTMYQLYEVLRQEEFITIKSVNLSQIQIEAIKQSIATKLQTCNAT